MALDEDERLWMPGPKYWHPQLKNWEEATGGAYIKVDWSHSVTLTGKTADSTVAREGSHEESQVPVFLQTVGESRGQRHDTSE